jgi:hypothetical protein
MTDPHTPMWILKIADRLSLNKASSDKLQAASLRDTMDVTHLRGFNHWPVASRIPGSADETPF